MDINNKTDLEILQVLKLSEENIIKYKHLGSLGAPFQRMMLVTKVPSLTVEADCDLLHLHPSYIKDNGHFDACNECILIINK